MRRLVLAAVAALFPAAGLAQALATRPAEPAIDDSARGQATVVANVVALEQPLLYNRFGSHNPHGMIYALARDVVVQPGPGGSPDPSSARLRDGKRPRPLVLRMNVGDTLEVRFLNLLPPDRNGKGDCAGAIGGEEGKEATNWPRTACAGVSVVGLPLARPPAAGYGGAGVRFEFGRDPDGGQGERAPAEAPALAGVTLRCEGDAVGPGGDATARQGLVAQRPGECRVHRFTADRPGAHLMLSHAAPVGGEGDGGSLSHGLFGVVVVEREGSRWYRSQVDADTFRLARDAARALRRADGARSPFLHYEAKQGGVPLLNIARELEGGEGGEPQQAAAGGKTLEIVHGDLNAIVYCPLKEREREFNEQARGPRRAPAAQPPTWHCASEPMREAARRPEGERLDPAAEWWRAAPAHRTFAVVFHDELKTRYAPPFDLLDPEVRLARLGGGRAPDGAPEPQGILLDGIRDGFAINYGASGMGTILLANRLGMGPARGCAECLYEEFFLQSWANGDPALLTPPLDEVRGALPERVARGARLYPDDPSNVHHGYLGDRVVFHNLHAGPKETHVFHLHAHQWRAGSDGQGAYRDSQTVAPLQAFSYEIDHGGGGNLNLTPGDAIFHCHLYPHFAQGMWALWRNHDVLEDGTRRLPDGVLGPGTDPRTGETRPDQGVPIPAVVPLPGQGMPPLPTYDDEPEDEADRTLAGRPGYPFFIPAEAGHRAPQPPMDMHDEGGLPRHRVVGDGERSGPNLVEAIARGDFVLKLEAVDLEVLPRDGDLRERRAMAFHAAQALPDRVRGSDGAVRPVPAVPAPSVRDPITPSDVHAAGQAVQDGRGVIGFYRLPQPDSGAPGLFRVNGRAPQPGAPFADPCRITDPDKRPPADAPPEERYAHSPLRVYDVSAVEMDLVVNAAGWHDPQAHVNVLTAEAERVEGRRMRAAPFFYRAHSGDCVEYRHQNRTKGALELDDFQAATPTDTIGQHIHLVKFDVLAADGSANGWNYEDGTFAAKHIRERVEAANRFGGARSAGGRQRLDPPAPGRFQATVQRWYADRIWQEPAVSAGPAGGPCTQGGKTAPGGKECRDVTLRTVFTHDHFGPSSIQQHGFYSALLVEPEESAWFTAEGRPMCSGVDSMRGGEPQDGCVMPVTQLFPPGAPEEGGGELFASARALWKPNAQALIVGAGGNDSTREYHRDHREFPMAIADFALLYAPGPPEVKKVSLRLAPEGQRAVMNWRHTRANGWPVDPPKAPEAISQKHHDPYKVNYAHDAVPLRIGRHSQMPDERPPGASPGAGGLRARCPQTRVNNLDEIRTQRAPLRDRPDLADPGDLANVFDSWCHGDPFGEVFEAYEGEEIQIRLIQGAQEVQHVFNAPGLRWRRDLDVTYGAQGTSRDVGDRFLRARGLDTARDRRTAREMQSGFVSSQEVGISEHFEFLTTADNITGRLGAADFLWHFGSKDAIWNGAWGLIRFHDGTITADQKRWQEGEDGAPTPDATCGVAREMASARGEARPDCAPEEVRDRLLSVRAARRSVGRPDEGGPAEAFRRQRDGEHAYQSPRVHFPQEEGRAREGLAASSCPSNVAWWRPPRGEGAAATQEWEFLPVRMRSYEVVAEPDSEPNGRGREVWQGEGGRIYDPRPLRFRAVRMATGVGVLPPRENEYRDLPPAPAAEGPLVLRALAGECVHVRLLHQAPGAALNPVEGEARLPGIASLNVTYENVRGPDGRPLDFPARAALGPEALRGLGVVLPSRRLSLLPQLVHQDPLDAGVLAGINSRAQDGDQERAFRRLAAERTAVDYMWFAGVTIPDPKQPDTAEHPDFTRVGFAVDFGPVPLASIADPFFHPAHGLVGTLVVHEADARLAPRPGDANGAWTDPGTPVWLGREDATRREAPFDHTDAVLVYRDGLNHYFQSRDRASGRDRISDYAGGRPLPDCPVCDDSYDRGERAAGWRAEPLWARLMRNRADPQRAVFPQPRALPPGGDPPPHMLPMAQLDGQPAFENLPDLNAVIFPRDHLLDPPARTPTVRAFEGIRLRLHVLQPAGRARQRVFTILGHDYRDGVFGPALPGGTPQPTDSGRAAACRGPDDAGPPGQSRDTLGASGWYGAPGASLLGPGRAVTATIHCPDLGRWLWRDGPAPMLGAGVWGWMEVRPPPPPAPVSAAPEPPAKPKRARTVEARR